MAFDGSIEGLTCLTQHDDYVAMTNRTALLQVGPLLDKRTNWTHFARTAGWYIRIPSVNVVFWQLCWFGAPATQYRFRSFLFSFLSAIVRKRILAPKWRQRLLSRGILTARFKYHFWGQNGSTLKACKIVTFNARRLKLWNRVYDKVSFKTKQKQISLHGHFKAFQYN